jgi:hypothetical protein
VFFKDRIVQSSHAIKIPHVWLCSMFEQKAKGLAAFAEKHGMDFARLIIGRKKGLLLQRADMNDSVTRKKARKMQSQSGLESLFA